MIIGNVGLGLFFLIILWIVALIVFVFGIKFQNNVAWVSLSVATSITIILILIPLEKPNHSVETQDISDKDNIYVYQVILLIFLILSALVGFTFFFILHCIEPVQPKRLTSFYIQQ